MNKVLSKYANFFVSSGDGSLVERLQETEVQCKEKRPGFQTQ
jgi:hypothetical protein